VALVVHPEALVLPLVVVAMGAVAVPHVLCPLAVVNLAVRELELALAVLLAVLPAAYVRATVTRD
jgi:hypothetical protein